jgi:hypothetical protein
MGSDPSAIKAKSFRMPTPSGTYRSESSPAGILNPSGGVHLRAKYDKILYCTALYTSELGKLVRRREVSENFFEKISNFFQTVTEFPISMVHRTLSSRDGAASSQFV